MQVNQKLKETHRFCRTLNSSENILAQSWHDKQGNVKCEFYYSHASLTLLRNLFSNRKYMKKVTCTPPSTGTSGGVYCLGSLAHPLALSMLSKDENYGERDLALLR